MPVQIKFQITGDKAVMAALAELGKTFGGAALDASMRRGMTVFKQQAEANWSTSKRVNKTAARARGSFAVRKTAGRPRNNPEFVLGETGDILNVVHWVEFGTQRHSVKPGASVRKGIFVGQPPMHPGNPATRFMTQAFEMKKVAAGRVIVEDMGRQVERQAAKLDAKYRGRR